MIPAMIPAMSGLGNFEKNSGRRPLWPVAIIGMRTAGMANVVSLKTSESARSPLILTGLSILNLVSGYVPLIRKHWFVVTLLRFFQDPRISDVRISNPLTLMDFPSFSCVNSKLSSRVSTRS